MTETIRWDRGDDGVVVLTLDDPARGANTMNDAYVRSMEATVARLECKTTVSDANESLKAAFAAARSAEAARSFYERAVHWSDANFIVAQAIDRMTKQQE